MLRWESSIEQARNKRSNHLIEYEGKIKTIAEWSLIKKIPYSRLERRINLLNWSISRALSG